MEHDRIEARYLTLAVVVRSMQRFLIVALIGTALEVLAPSLVSMTVIAGVALVAAGTRVVGDVVVLAVPEAAGRAQRAA